MNRVVLRTAGALLALLFVGCGPAPSTVPLPLGDLALFGERVEPHLEEQCGSGGCHGRADRPFSLYAPGQHRADPERVWLDEPLTSEEIEENARRTSAFALEGPPEQTLVVQKPLAVDEGGLWHGGGDVFAAPDDPGCRALMSWLRTTRTLDGGTP